MITSPRFLTSLLLFVTLFALAACGNGETAGGDAPAANPEPTTPGAENATPPDSPRSQDFSALPPPYNEASYSLGRRTFKLCGSCHTLKQGAQNLVGPNLYGVIGREAGSLDGFNYSPTLQKADFTWTPAKLEEWLSNPRDFLPGNNMTFSGVHRPNDRHAVIAYIMSETGYAAGSDKPEADTAPPG